MEFLLSFALSLTFGLFWLWWFDRHDLFDKEPRRFLALIFVLSMPLSVLAGLFEYTVDGGSGKFSEDSGFLVAALFYLGIVAVIEELFKFFVVFTVAYPNNYFNEPIDGIIYAAAAALGFASFENAFYILDRGPLVLLLRGPFSTLGHVLFSALWGAALGLALHEPDRRRRIRLILNGLLLSILCHGIYNILISLSYPFFGAGWEWLALSGPLFLFALYIFVAIRIAHALHVSSFNPANQAREALHLLRAGRGQRTAKPLPVEVTAPPNPRYAPNPNRYQFRGQPSGQSNGQTNNQPIGQPAALTYPACQNLNPATVNCEHCGAANLVEPPHPDCYNCGRPMPPPAVPSDARETDSGRAT